LSPPSRDWVSCRSTYAGEDARERVDRSAVEHAPWTLSIADHTAGWSWTLPNVGYNSSLSSAEWILEATSFTTGVIEPLADFGAATVFADLVNGANPGLTLAQGAN
jgi:hypothetical protein